MPIEPERAPVASSFFVRLLVLVREASEYSLMFTLCAASIGALFALLGFGEWSVFGLLAVALSALGLRQCWNVLTRPEGVERPLYAKLLLPQLVALAPLLWLYAVVVGGGMNWLLGLSTVTLVVSLAVLVCSLILCACPDLTSFREKFLDWFRDNVI
jgi:hypothetical protein